MRLRILEVARDDLIEGFHFYEDKEKVDCRKKPSWIRQHIKKNR